jgi:hypothetical protein
MDKTEIFDIENNCESPVYLENSSMSPLSSPVSSPVFVSRNPDLYIEPPSDFTQKLILPPLDNSMLPSASASASTSMSNTKDIDTDKSVTSKDVVVDLSSSTSAPTKAEGTKNEKGEKNTEMVTVVVKDFNYCKEEFIKQVKENNISVKPDTIMRLIRIAMVIVEQSKESGANKKQFVIDLLKELFLNNAEVLSEHKLEVFHLLENGVVSDSIDVIVDASKGKFDLNKLENVAEEVAKSCFMVCFEKLFKKK